MNKAYAINKDYLYIHFSIVKDDYESGKFMNANMFVNITYFRKKIFQNNDKYILSIKIKDYNEEVVSGIVMWFLNRDMYDSNMNNTIYKKQANNPNIKLGYTMAKNTFELKFLQQLNEKILNTKFSKR